MEDLLESFDPLHAAKSSKRKEPLFPAASNGSGSGSSVVGGFAAPPSASSSHAVAIPLHEAPLPLDLLSLSDGDDQQDGSHSSNKGGVALAIAVAAAAAQRRQEDVLGDLARAEAEQPTFRERHRPPRRLSKSGLMMAFEGEEERQHSASGSLVAVPSATCSQLFHPSSPPAGTSLESLRQKQQQQQQSQQSGYFAAAAAANTSTLGRSAGSNNHSGSGTGSRSTSTSTSTSWAHHRYNDTSSSSTTRTSSTFPQIDNSDLFTHFSSRSTIRPSAGKSRQSSGSFLNDRPPPAAAGPSSPPPRTPRQLSSNSNHATSKRSHTFDFPTDSSLGPIDHRVSTLPAATLPSSNGSGVPRGPSPVYPSSTSSLTIDSEPLPSLILKIPAVASSSPNRILTEDMAEGIRPALSTRLRLCKSWSMAYSLDAHGTSLSTLCARVQQALQKSAGGCVLCIRDMEGATFGGYVNEPFVLRREGYYGNGEWCVALPLLLHIYTADSSPCGTCALNTASYGRYPPSLLATSGSGPS